MSLNHAQPKGLRISNHVEHIRVPIYQRDGSGRDNYCGFDNGGNTLPFHPGTRGYMLNAYGATPLCPGS